MTINETHYYSIVFTEGEFSQLRNLVGELVERSEDTGFSRLQLSEESEDILGELLKRLTLAG